MESHDKLYKKLIPDALSSLNNRNQLLEQYIVKVERDFLSMSNDSGGGVNGDPSKSKFAAGEKVKKQLVQALSATVDDINNIATSLEALVANQTRQIDTLSVDVRLLNQKVQINREHASSASMDRIVADCAK
jgi:hypothetical protein